MAVPGFYLPQTPALASTSAGPAMTGDDFADQTVVRRQVRALRRKGPARSELTVSLGTIILLSQDA